jgi:hypothetical protein
VINDKAFFERLNAVMPAQFIGKLRLVWPHLLAMKTRGLSYGQMAELLKEIHQIEVRRVQSLRSAYCRLRKNPPEIPPEPPKSRESTAVVVDPLIALDERVKQESKNFNLGKKRE